MQFIILITHAAFFATLASALPNPAPAIQTDDLASLLPPSDTTVGDTLNSITGLLRGLIERNPSDDTANIPSVLIDGVNKFLEPVEQALSVVILDDDGYLPVLES
ncbi:hypothetical protein LTS10_000193 [Elasticomyces elasticus]|nr:hypothetical protein LTS10_000193 [Elasticomyces elasticus]